MNPDKLLVLDLGNLLDPYEPPAINRIKQDTFVKAMEMTGCRALGLGSLDISGAFSFLTSRHAPDMPPVVAANLDGPDDLDPFIKKYVIIPVNGIRFGITGVMDDQTADFPRFVITDARAALRQALPPLQSECDFIILLSQFDTEQTAALAAAFPAVDLALCTDRFLVDLDDPAGLRVANVINRSRQLGLVRIETAKAGKPKVTNAWRIDLDDQVPDEPEIKTLVDGALDGIEREKETARRKAARKNAEKEALKTLEMTPEEFIESYKNQTKRKLP